MEGLAEWLYATPLAEWLRFSRWGYAAVNTTHVLGIAMLTGAILPLNLNFMGFWKSMPSDRLMSVLSPVAACGLMLAVITGTMLFITRAPEYIALPLFLVKILLVTAGTIHALSFHYRKPDLRQKGADVFIAGMVSALIWLSALVCGRLLAFVAA